MLESVRVGSRRALRSVGITDSDSDNFLSLKKSDGSRPRVKESIKSPVRLSSTQGKTVPATPKSAPPPQPKHTPTSVFDYFGNRNVQRSDKKLVASTKRKAVSMTTTRFFACPILSNKPPHTPPHLLLSQLRKQTS